MKNAVFYIVLAAMALPAGLAEAQTSSEDYYDSGVLAFREQRYSEAVRDFERAIENQPEYPEAHFLLARIYYETPLKDTRKAKKSLETALEQDPGNIQYMVAKLLQLRDEPWNFISEKIRESQRRALAVKILELDSTNAYAHEELGASYIRDFWRYRNAIMIPDHEIGRSYYHADDYVENFGNENTGLIFDPTGQAAVTSDELEALAAAQQQGLNNIAFVDDPTDVFLNDEFDVEGLQDMGVPVVELSRRAERVYQRAVDHLKKALESNPRHRSVYDYLMEIYVLKGEDEEALKLLANMYVYYPDDEDLWTYLGYAHYKAGNIEASAKSFETAMTKMPPELVKAYNDLSNVISDRDRKAYNADPVGFAAQYWSSKDPRFLTPFNERKLEHYSRLVYADLLYDAPGIGQRGWETERGKILVRYGPPKSELTIFPNTKEVVHDVGGYGGIQADEGGGGRVLQSNDRFEELNTYNIWDYGDFKFVFEDPFRTGEYRLYSPRADVIAAGALPWENDYTIIAKETIAEIPERYEYEAPGRQINLPYLVNVFKGSSDQADVYVHYGVPIEDDFDHSAENIEVTAREGTFLISEDHDILVEKRRSIYGLRTNQILTFDDANLWVNTQSFSGTPGNRDVSVEFELGSGSTVAVQRRSITIPDYSADRLALSDVLLAYNIEEAIDNKPAGGGHIVRNNLSINPAPWSVFSIQQPVYLYFEVYGLKQGNDGSRQYEVEAILSKKDDRTGIGRVIGGIFSRGDKGVSLTLPFSTNSPDDGQYLILDASNQEAGLYTLVVKVTDTATGKTVESEKDIFFE